MSNDVSGNDEIMKSKTLENDTKSFILINHGKMFSYMVKKLMIFIE